MVGPSKKMCVSDEVLCELLQKNEYSDISDSEYSEIKVKISSCGKQSVSSDEESVSDNSSMQHGIWTKSGAERKSSPFTGTHGINVDLKDPSNPLEYFELFCHQKLWK
jgi:hypothetical protein